MFVCQAGAVNLEVNVDGANNALLMRTITIALAIIYLHAQKKCGFPRSSILPVRN